MKPNSKTRQRLGYAVILFSMTAIGLLDGQVAVGGLQSGEQSNSSSPKSSREWIEKKRELKVGQPVNLKTFRFYRSSGQTQEGSLIRSKVQVQKESKSAVQVQTGIENLTIPGMNRIEIFSKELPHRDGIHAGQIVVELKKVNKDSQDLAIGFFAPNSWVESRNGKVELFAGQVDLAQTVTSSYWIGVQCEEKPLPSSGSATQVQTALIVGEVVDGGAAQKAGLAVGDQIASWNRKPLSSVTSLVRTIQSNRSRKAKLGIVRDGRKKDLTIVPQSRVLESPRVQTLIVPAAQAQIAQQKIEQLEKMVVGNEQDADRHFRVLLVGPGVNFGNKDIELHVNPDIQKTKAHLKQLMDRVAERSLESLSKKIR